MLKDFFTCELFLEKKFQIDNQLVQKMKVNKEGKIKNKLAKTITAPKNKKSFKASKVIVIVIKS